MKNTISIPIICLLVTVFSLFPASTVAQSRYSRQNSQTSRSRTTSQTTRSSGSVTNRGTVTIDVMEGLNKAKAAAEERRGSSSKNDKDKKGKVSRSKGNAASASSNSRTGAQKDVPREQDDIVLIVDGEGKDKTTATQNALRNAIEQAYGVFVSANTDILNDEIVKEEIATISSGNIKSYKELSSMTLPNGNSTVTLSAIVSIGKLISYAHSKGASAEFAGQTFMMNMKMRELNKKNEKTALDNCLKHIELIPDMYDYSISIGTPKEVSGGYSFPLSFVVRTNDNYDAAIELLMNTLSSLSLSKSEVADYQENESKYKEILVYKGYKVVRTSTSSGRDPRNPGSNTITTRTYGPDYEEFFLRNADYFLEDRVMMILVNKLISYTVDIEYVNKEPRKVGLDQLYKSRINEGRTRPYQQDADVPPYYKRLYYTNNDQLDRIHNEKIKKLQLMTWYNRGSLLSEFNRYGESSPGKPRIENYPYSILHKGELYSFTLPLFIGAEEAADVKGISIKPCQYQPKAETPATDSFWDNF